MAITVAKLRILCRFLGTLAPVCAVSSASGNSTQTRIECRSPRVKDKDISFFHYVDTAITAFTLRSGYKVIDTTNIIVTPTDETTFRRSSAAVDHSNLPNDNQLGTLGGPFFQTFTFSRWIVPTKWKTVPFQSFITKFVNDDGVLPANYRFTPRNSLPIYLNDLGQNNTPIYYPKRNI